MKVKILFLSVIAVLVLILAASSTSAVAASHYCPGAPYIFYFGGPAIARADSGDTIEMSTTSLGIVDPNHSYYPNGVRAFGSFVHKDPAGNIVSSGTWIAESLLGMQEYGCDEENENAFGGRALIKIRLIDARGFEYPGKLEVENPSGHLAPANAVEGIRLKLPWLDFNQPISGYTYFTVL